MAIKIETTPAGPDFPISSVPEMPSITARVSGPELPTSNTAPAAGAAPTASVTYEWSVQLTFDASEVKNGPQRTIVHPPISGTTRVPEFPIRFSQIRGGKLQISVRARLNNGQVLTADLSANNGRPLRIVGTNPSAEQLHAALPYQALRKLVQLESSCRQFVDGLPLFSGDQQGGVGLMQLTHPTPSDDQVWDWTANVSAGVALFESKLSVARSLPRQIRGNALFQRKADEFKSAWLNKKKTPLRIEVPELTSDQTEENALRAYNGFGGTDRFLGNRHLNEFRVPTEDAPTEKDGFRLVVRIGSGNATGYIDWERVPEDDRVPRANGGYVRMVMSKNDF